MRRKGDCWHNAVAESFFSTLKTELVQNRSYASHDEATASIGVSTASTTRVVATLISGVAVR